MCRDESVIHPYTYFCARWFFAWTKEDKRMKKFQVALLYSLSANAPQETTEDDTPWDRWNELDSEKSVAGYQLALREGGHAVIPLEGDAPLIDNLLKYKPDICFNTCEGHYGKSREA